MSLAAQLATESGQKLFWLVGQVVVVALLATAAAWVVSANGIRTPLNAIWMFGIPLAVTILGNRTAKMRLGMGFANFVVVLFSPELLAHSVGYCLY